MRLNTVQRHDYLSGASGLKALPDPLHSDTERPGIATHVARIKTKPGGWGVLIQAGESQHVVLERKITPQIRGDSGASRHFGGVCRIHQFEIRLR